MTTCRGRAAVAVGVGALLILGACSDEHAETNGPDMFITEFESYELTYTSTCGDGPFFTEGTTITVDGDMVTVTGGEEPAEVGSISAWNEKIAEGYEADDLTVETELGESGEPVSIKILSGALDRDYCVDVSEFSQP